MAKLMSDREMSLFRLAMYYKGKYRESNPDIGMGYSIKNIAQEIAKESGFKFDDDDIAECYEEIQGS